jgi:hypothetical protein
LGTLFEIHFWYMYEALVGDIYMLGTHLAHILGIWLRHFIDDILWYLVYDMVYG